MTREQAINYLKAGGMSDEQIRTVVDAFTCKDAVSRENVMKCFKKWQPYMSIGVWNYERELSKIPSVTPQPKIGHCKDCKWWKDSDGIFRRGIDAESQCPMNRKEVFEGDGYCYMFEPQESEDK